MSSEGPPNLCQYLDQDLFSPIVSALEAVLIEARQSQVLEHKNPRFDPFDFMTEWIYKNNPRHLEERKEVQFLDIPFVQEWLELNPRPPLPLSQLLTEDQAATIIQSRYRGHLARNIPEVKELREYQQEISREFLSEAQKTWEPAELPAWQSKEHANALDLANLNLNPASIPSTEEESYLGSQSAHDIVNDLIDDVINELLDEIDLKNPYSEFYQELKNPSLGAFFP